eukprot:jgi/Bigna1/134214/aug1.24_g8922
MSSRRSSFISNPISQRVKRTGQWRVWWLYSVAVAACLRFLSPGTNSVRANNMGCSFGGGKKPRSKLKFEFREQGDTSGKGDEMDGRSLIGTGEAGTEAAAFLLARKSRGAGRSHVELEARLQCDRGGNFDSENSRGLIAISKLHMRETGRVGGDRTDDKVGSNSRVRDHGLQEQRKEAKSNGDQQWSRVVVRAGIFRKLFEEFYKVC